MKRVFILLLFLLPFLGYAQFSKTHYIPPITAQNNIVEDQYLYISTPTLTNVNFRIIEVGGNVINGTVRNNAPYTYSIGNGLNSQLFTPKTSIGVLQNKGYIIEADDLVYVSVRITSQKNTNTQGVVSYAHAGGIVSKGNSALGKTFRLGAMLNPLNNDNSLLNFASIFATENGTTVTISNIENGTTLTNNTILTGPITFTLNKNESYVLAMQNINNGMSPSNSSKIIGGLVTSDKPIVVNSGSFGGSNSTQLQNNGNPSGRDVGFDQIVGADKIGKEYIFIQGFGTSELERVLLIAQFNGTNIFINGNTFPVNTLPLNAGEYIILDSNHFVGGNLYVSTTENVFAYQSIGGSPSPANQNLFFVPPLNCSTPNIVDNIPYINEIGTIKDYYGILNIVTEVGANVKINGFPIAATPIPINGNSNYERYTVNNLTGHVAVVSTKQVYVSYFGNSGVATYGGYYSGFDLKPEIGSEKIDVTNSNCIPNVNLKVSSISKYDTFQWFYNKAEILGATENNYTPTLPGYYQVRGSISGCGSTVFSDEIPVSNCAKSTTDSDLTIDNIDIDYDNDGITNCIESYGNQPIDISTVSGNLSIGNYSNSYTSTISTSSNASTTPFSANSDGTFITEIPAGKENFVNYKLTFSEPISFGMEYVSTANPLDLINVNAEYIINSDIDKTITVLNPTDQLEIDTNYDGVYERGVTQFSSFEIRFRLNNTIPLAAGTGTFKFLTYLTNSISITHKNLSDDTINKSTFKFFATCVPKDSDSNGITDDLDADSDNDGIPDVIEAQDNTAKFYSGIDSNSNGLNNNFEPGFIPVDTDSDGIPDYLDLDSDNDGIYDAIETGSSLTDTDSDGIKNYRDFDSDNDNCSDVIEAGFLDPNNDNFLGNIPINVDAKGIVTTGVGYTTPHPNYLISAPIFINTQPINTEVCELGTTVLSVQTNVIDSYQWQLNTDNGNTWADLTPNTTYTGVTTNQLQISNAVLRMQNYQYRVFLNKNGNTCGLYSNTITLTVNHLPIVVDVKLFQCDDDQDAKTYFNLTEANHLISTNYLNETFSYYYSETGAENADILNKISNPIAYFASNNEEVWVRVESEKNCYQIAKLIIYVSTTQIPNDKLWEYEACDDYVDSNNTDIDGVSSFNFENAKTELRSIFDADQLITITFYRNLEDALAETYAISDITNYRNEKFNGIEYKYQQNIYVRIDSDIDNACLGLGHHITLTVNPIPVSNVVSNLILCDDDSDGNDTNGKVQTFNLGSQTTTVLGTQAATDYTVTYHTSQADAMAKINPLVLTNFENSSNPQKIYINIKNELTGCQNPHQSFDLIVNPIPVLNTPTTYELCDDLNDGNNRNGLVQSFNLTSKNIEILNGLPASQYTVTYHLTLSDANNGINNLISPFTNTIANSQLLVVRVTNNLTGCFSTNERLQLRVNPLPVITSIPDFELCDDSTDANDANGFRTFDLESKTATILGNQSNSNFKVTYHRSQTEATNGNNPITSPFTNEQKDQQKIYIRILNLTTSCFIADQSFNIVVKQKPVFTVDTEQIVCLNNLPLTLSIKSTAQPYQFDWYDANGNLLLANSTTLNVTKGGTYTVKTSNALGCDRSIDIDVKESIITSISIDNITIVDNSNNNSITINNNNQELGIGDYEYALDNDFGPYQDEPYFEQVEAGVRTLFIRDKNNCGIVSLEIPIIGNPGFLTPNGDGYNDTWQIQGIRLYPKSVIYIFDRFGKVIATINPIGSGWDGTYKGKQVDSGEYWFSAQLDNGRIIKGHFSLIRR